MDSKTRSLCAIALFASAVPAKATLGVFEHGNGIKSLGMGGVGYAIGEESTSLVANPAHVIGLGARYDLGVHALTPLGDVKVVDNAAGPDSEHRNDGRRYFAIPQGGVTLSLGQRWALGVSASAAGVGPDYPRSPYARFGGAQRASLFLNTAGLSTALAYKVNADHALGASLNLAYQTLQIEGVGFIAGVSRDPDHLTNQGKDGELGAGFTLGWRGQLTPRLSAGVAYRSKTWTGKHEEYRGLLPEEGLLELPQIWGAGLGYALNPEWTLGVDFQRYQYSGQKALGSSVSQLDPPNGVLFGDDNGPGFGYRNQNVYKFGAAWKVSPVWTLRAGYLDATQMVSAQETLFGMLAPVSGTRHVSVGGTWTRQDWEVSAHAAWSPRDGVNGSDSIPRAFGGGEANVGFESVGLGISLGRRFGR